MNILRFICLLFGLSAMVEVQADNKKVNISGKIVPAPCTVGPIPTVDLGTIRDTDMALVGTSSSPVTFSLKLTGCPTPTTKVTADFSGTPDTNNGNLYKITQGAGYASGLGVMLTNAGPGNEVLKSGSSTQVAVDGSKNATFMLQAQAVTTNSNLVAGDIDTSVTVTFTYQ